jgi:PII-like signaling protein
MNGYQLTFFTEQNRRHGHQALSEWLMACTKSLGIRGVTGFMAEEGFARHGRLHSAHFFELADQPVEITMIVTEGSVPHISIFAT